MIPGSGGGNPNPNMQMPGFGVPQPGANVISAPPIITGPRFGMGIPPTMMGGVFPGGGLGMMPNPAIGNPMMPGMFPGMMQNVPPPMMGSGNPVMYTEQPVVELIDAALRKVFVKNIPEDVPDNFMEMILKECGNVIQWKRTKNEKDIPLRFGTCEFETVEGVLRCLRIMNNLKLLDSYLQINYSEKTEKYIAEWSETKKKEWQATKGPSSKEEDFERYLQKDDANALERIHILVDNFDVNKAREAKEKEEEKKEHPKEKERDRKKKMLLKEQEKNYKKELQKWLETEDRMDKERRKEKEREREKEKDKEYTKQRLLEKELEYDSEEERRRKSNAKQLEQRKKTRQKELEEDEMERRKEIAEEEERRKVQEETHMEIEPPMDNILPPQDGDAHDNNPLTRAEAPTLINPRPSRSSKFTLITEPEVPEVRTGEVESSKPTFQIDIGGKTMKEMKLNPAQQMFKEELEHEDATQELLARKHKLDVKVEKPVLTNQNIVTVDPHSKSATIQFNVPVPVAPAGDSQRMLGELQSIIKQIPSSKSDLFGYNINWTLLATSDLIEKKVKPWLKKQSMEYIGQEEMDFVNVILKRLANRESPQQILKRVEKLLDEDAEDFTMKLWRMLIFELLKLEKLGQ